MTNKPPTLVQGGVGGGFQYVRFRRSTPPPLDHIFPEKTKQYCASMGRFIEIIMGQEAEQPDGGGPLRSSSREDGFRFE